VVKEKPSGWSLCRSDGSHDGQGHSKLSKSQGGLPGLSPLRSDGSRGNQMGRLDCVSGGQKTLRTKLNLKGDFQVRVHSGQMVLVVVNQGCWTVLMVTKNAQMRVRK
jgi:hypothetical protein